jgi:threonine dehydrogenase-like Zn-dependent dehydrogenase
MPSLPSHHRALVLEAIGQDLQVKTVPCPKPDTGSAIVQILSAGVLSYHREIYDGTRHYDFSTPLVGGISAIGRVVALGPDAVALQEGQLVWVDCVISARDDRDSLFLTAIHGGSNARSQKLMRDVWRDGTFAEYAKMPLENCIPLDEARLCGALRYTPDDLMYLYLLLVAFGGLRDIRLEPGETVIVCPATGGFGGAGVQVAVAMGARVIAMGRNEKELARLKEHVESGTAGASVETVKITGDVDADAVALQKFGVIDAVIDFTPPFASKSTHFQSAMRSLRRGGRCSLMGFVQDVIHWNTIALNITLKGKLMYDREDIIMFVKMLERGMFPKGKAFVDVQTFGLQDWKEAFAAAATHAGVGKVVTIAPRAT